jgi:hypothetical protein
MLASSHQIISRAPPATKFRRTASPWAWGVGIFESRLFGPPIYNTSLRVSTYCTHCTSVRQVCQFSTFAIAPVCRLPLRALARISTSISIAVGGARRWLACSMQPAALRSSTRGP